jgi:hypothetical protein
MLKSVCTCVTCAHCRWQLANGDGPVTATLWPYQMLWLSDRMIPPSMLQKVCFVNYLSAAKDAKLITPSGVCVCVCVLHSKYLVKLTDGYVNTLGVSWQVTILRWK